VEKAARLNLEAAMPVVSIRCKAAMNQSNFSSDAQAWHVLDYPMERTHGRAAKLRFQTNRSGTSAWLYGLVRGKLYEDIGSVRAGTKESVYGQVFLPLFQTRCSLRLSEEIHAAYTRFIGTDYVWRWDSKSPRATAGNQ